MTLLFGLPGKSLDFISNLISFGVATSNTANVATSNTATFRVLLLATPDNWTLLLLATR